MNQEKAMEIVNKLIFGLQRARTASREGVENVASAKGINNPEIVNGVLEDSNPWLHGPKAEALLQGLVMVSERGRVTGMELYNFMTIIHRLDPVAAAMAGTFAEYTFPKPEIEWITALR